MSTFPMSCRKTIRVDLATSAMSGLGDRFGLAGRTALNHGTLRVIAILDCLLEPRLEILDGKVPRLVARCVDVRDIARQDRLPGLREAHDFLQNGDCGRLEQAGKHGDLWNASRVPFRALGFVTAFLRVVVFPSGNFCAWGAAETAGP